LQRSTRRSTPERSNATFPFAPTHFNPPTTVILKGKVMRILAPVDGSRTALKALKHACKLMRNFAGLKVTLVSVHDDVALRNARSLVGSKAVDDYLHQLSEKDLDAARKMLDKEEIAYTVEIRTGHVAQEIVELADSEQFDLIVMGNKGRSALRDLLIGSVAQRVLAQARTPVLLVK